MNPAGIPWGRADSCGAGVLANSFEFMRSVIATAIYTVGERSLRILRPLLGIQAVRHGLRILMTNTSGDSSTLTRSTGDHHVPGQAAPLCRAFGSRNPLPGSAFPLAPRGDRAREPHREPSIRTFHAAAGLPCSESSTARKGRIAARGRAGRAPGTASRSGHHYGRGGRSTSCLRATCSWLNTTYPRPETAHSAAQTKRTRPGLAIPDGQ